MRKVLILFILPLLVFSLTAAPVYASSDGLGLAQGLNYSYMRLEAGPFLGEVPLFKINKKFQPHLNLGLSLQSPWPGIYGGAKAKLDIKGTKNKQLKLDQVTFFGGKQFSLFHVPIKIEAGPVVNEDTVYYDATTYGFFAGVAVVFNPFEVLGHYTPEGST